MPQQARPHRLRQLSELREGCAVEVTRCRLACELHQRRHCRWTRGMAIAALVARAAHHLSHGVRHTGVGILHMHTHAFGEAVCCLKNSSCALPAVPCAPLRWSRKRFWPLRQTYSTCCRLRAGGGLASIARADEATSLH